jgi:Protein of unknown function (DUF2934)
MSASAIERLDSVPLDTTQSETQILQHHDIAVVAYALWRHRGCSEGSAEQDWHEAEQRVRLVEQPFALTRR